MSLERAFREHPLLSMLGVRFQPSGNGKPLALMLPGLACTAEHFDDPLNASMRGEAGNALPFDWVLTTHQPPANGAYWPFPGSSRFSLCPPLRTTRRRVDSLWARVTATGCGAVTWTPRRPSGPIAYAVEEAAAICEAILADGKHRLVLIGHSRGGLVSRRLLAVRPDIRRRTEALIMLACPNRGSRLATLMDRLKWLSGEVLTHMVVFRRGVSGEERNLLARFLRNYLFFVERGALRELRHDSPMFGEFARREKKEQSWSLPYYHMLGTSPKFNRIYVRVGGGYHTVMELWDGMPYLLSPEELQVGKGDGLVSTDRGALGWEAGVWTYDANHGELLIDRRVQDRIAGILEVM